MISSLMMLCDVAPIGHQRSLASPHMGQGGCSPGIARISALHSQTVQCWSYFFSDIGKVPGNL
jgi:hypothetical protein